MWPWNWLHLTPLELFRSTLFSQSYLRLHPLVKICITFSLPRCLPLSLTIAVIISRGQRYRKSFYAPIYYVSMIKAQSWARRPAIKAGSIVPCAVNRTTIISLRRASLRNFAIVYRFAYGWGELFASADSLNPCGVKWAVGRKWCKEQSRFFHLEGQRGFANFMRRSML